MTIPTQVGWIDERGILFPLSCFNPDRPSPYDVHKAGWEKVYKLPDGEPTEILASRLIDAWVDSHGKQIPWAKAVEITAIVTEMSDAERERLLNLD